MAQDLIDTQTRLSRSGPLLGEGDVSCAEAVRNKSKVISVSITDLDLISGLINQKRLIVANDDVDHRNTSNFDARRANRFRVDRRCFLL
jgi:hypothetical protein